MLIAGKKSPSVTVGWRDQRMWVIHRRSGVSIDRVHTMVFIMKKETDVQWMELEAMALRTINRGLEVRVGGNPTELGTIYPIHGRVCWHGKQKLVHWGLYPLVKGGDL